MNALATSGKLEKWNWRASPGRPTRYAREKEQHFTIPGKGKTDAEIHLERSKQIAVGSLVRIRAGGNYDKQTCRVIKGTDRHGYLMLDVVVTKQLFSGDVTLIEENVDADK